MKKEKTKEEIMAYWEGREDGFTRGLIASAIISILIISLTFAVLILLWH